MLRDQKLVALIPVFYCISHLLQKSQFAKPTRYFEVTENYWSFSKSFNPIQASRQHFYTSSVNHIIKHVNTHLAMNISQLPKSMKHVALDILKIYNLYNNLTAFYKIWLFLPFFQNNPPIIPTLRHNIAVHNIHTTRSTLILSSHIPLGFLYRLILSSFVPPSTQSSYWYQSKGRSCIRTAHKSVPPHHVTPNSLQSALRVTFGDHQTLIKSRRANRAVRYFCTDFQYSVQTWPHLVRNSAVATFLVIHGFVLRNGILFKL